MPPTRRPAPRLSDAQLGSMLELVKGADSVELKLTVPSISHRATIQGLPIDPVEAEPRQVFFFDTPNLDLDKAGLVVRARRIQGGRGDTVVKLRPVVPNELPDEVRRSASFNVEVDAMPGGYVASGSMKGKSTAAEIRDVLGGAIPLRKIFTKEQRAFFTAHAPSGIAMDQLVPLGPTFLLKLVWFPKELNRKFVAELWLYQDGSRILELSTKCLPSETVPGRGGGPGLPREATASNLGGAQQTKTRTALEFFRSELSAAAKPRRGPGRPRGSTTRGRDDQRNPHDPVDPRAAGRRDGGGLDRDAVDGGRAGHGGRRDGGDSGSDRDGSPPDDDGRARRRRAPARRPGGPRRRGSRRPRSRPPGEGVEPRRPEGPRAGRAARAPERAPDPDTTRAGGLRPAGSRQFPADRRALVERQSLERADGLMSGQLHEPERHHEPDDRREERHEQRDLERERPGLRVDPDDLLLDLLRLAFQLGVQRRVAHQLGVVVQGRRDLLLVLGLEHRAGVRQVRERQGERAEHHRAGERQPEREAERAAGRVDPGRLADPLLGDRGEGDVVELRHQQPEPDPGDHERDREPQPADPFGGRSAA